jgi:tRNA A-37 threonylcarbamoyl transferase component Bud32
MSVRDTDKHQERLDAVLADYMSQIDRGEQPDRDAFLGAHPDLAEDLAGYFEVQDRMQRLAGPVLDANPTFGLGGGPGPATIAAGVKARAEGGFAPAPPLTPLPSDDPLPAGSLLGQYKLHEVIGEGGMGRVYRARHAHLDRTVAIKVLAPRFCRDGALVQRFHREARALARLQHPHIVAIHDMGSQGEVHYFVMEHVEGPNLRQVMSAGEVDAARALSLVARICGALQFAHDAGIVHRDIKPENILLDRSGNPRVADFGLAKVLQDELAPGNLTRTDMVIGTFNYMAPEQKHSSRVDHRVDIYALGVVLYEMLTGKLPAGHFPLPSQVAEVAHGVDDLVLKALAAEPDRRYLRANDLAKDCTSALSGRGAPGALAERPVHRPPTELVVVDAWNEKRLGQGLASWLRITGPEDDDLSVVAWARDEIAIASDDETEHVRVAAIDAPSGPWAGHETLGQPGLHVTLPDDDCTVYVPEGLPVSIAGAETEITVNGLRASLRIEPGEGHVHVRDHRGRLEIDRIDEGRAFVEGLDTADLRVSTRKGDLTVAGLLMTSGRGVLHSDDGDLALGIEVESSSVSFEAKSLSGGVINDIESLGEAKGSWFSARLGAGAARLEADSYSGDVRIGHGAHLVRAELLREALSSLGWTALWASLAYYWLNLEWIALLIICWWGVENVVNVLKRFRRLDPDISTGDALKQWFRPKARPGSWHDRAGAGLADALRPRARVFPGDDAAWEHQAGEAEPAAKKSAFDAEKQAERLGRKVEKGARHVERAAEKFAKGVERSVEAVGRAVGGRAAAPGDGPKSPGAQPPAPGAAAPGAGPSAADPASAARPSDSGPLSERLADRMHRMWYGYPKGGDPAKGRGHVFDRIRQRCDRMGKGRSCGDDRDENGPKA